MHTKNEIKSSKRGDLLKNINTMPTIRVLFALCVSDTRKGAVFIKTEAPFWVYFFFPATVFVCVPRPCQSKARCGTRLDRCSCFSRSLLAITTKADRLKRERTGNSN